MRTARYRIKRTGGALNGYGVYLQVSEDGRRVHTCLALGPYEGPMAALRALAELGWPPKSSHRRAGQPGRGTA